MIAVNMSDQEAKAVLSLGSKIRRAQGLQEVPESTVTKKPRSKKRTVSKSAKKHANSLLNRKINGHKSRATLALRNGEREIAIENLQAALALPPANWNGVRDNIQRKLATIA